MTLLNDATNVNANIDFNRAFTIAPDGASGSIAYSDSELLIPDVTGDSAPGYFGGLDAQAFGNDTATIQLTGGSLFRLQATGGPFGGDWLNGRVNTSGNGQFQSAAVYWAPSSDFATPLGVGETYGLGADAEMSILAQVLGNLDNVSYHFVINEGGQFYISKVVETLSRSDPQQTVGLGDGTDFLTTEWSIYNPATGSLRFDVTTATFETAGTIGFDDVQGVGVYLAVGPVGTGGVDYRPVFADLAVSGSVVPEPATASLAALGGSLMLVRRKRRI